MCMDRKSENIRKTEEYLRECHTLIEKIEKIEATEEIFGRILSEKGDQFKESLKEERELLKVRLAERRWEIAELINTGNLAPAMQRVVALRYLRGMKWRSIADVTNMSIRWVYKTRAEAIRIFSHLLFPAGNKFERT